jgi:hypothetical protein
LPMNNHAPISRRVAFEFFVMQGPQA